VINHSLKLSSISEFDIEPFVTRFRKKKFTVNNLADIDEVLLSSDYAHFINVVYGSFEPKDYFIAGEIIDSFWKILISKDLLEKFTNNLNKKLKIS